MVDIFEIVRKRLNPRWGVQSSDKTTGDAGWTFSKLTLNDTGHGITIFTPNGYQNTI